jgi:hypothetical protein
MWVSLLPGQLPPMYAAAADDVLLLMADCLCVCLLIVCVSEGWGGGGRG